MKLDALDHPKLHHLSSLLGIARPTAIGHLELLWAYTARYAPDGELTKHPYRAIARACDWMGDAGQFIDSLIESGWLDSDDSPLVRGDPCTMHIHDWADHRPRWVDSKLIRAGRKAAGRTAEQTAEPTAVLTAEATPSLVKPSQAKPKDCAPSGRARELDAEALAEVCQLDLKRLTPTERGRFNKAIKGLRSVGASPDSIRARAVVYRRLFADCSLTPTGLEANWGKCDPSPPKPAADLAKAAATAALVQRSLDADRRRLEEA